MSLDLDAMLQSADDPAWRELIDKAGQTAQLQRSVSADVYRAAFNTPAGREVLEDLARRYVHVSRCIPGEGTDAAFYREGMAQVVFDIISTITEEDNGD